MSAVLEEILREIERLRREVDALRCLDQPTLTGHTHTQAESHYSPDTDAAPTSLHHTLGGGAYQAAAGNHSHTQAQSHNSADTDTATSALHHTLGGGANQASAGNHGHAGVYSPVGHAHTQAESHYSADTDSSAGALHHTLGAGANQAAAGNHGHLSTSWCRFHAWVGSGILNVTGDGTGYIVVFGSESYDSGSNYNNANGYFTAPYSGMYHFDANVSLNGIVAGMSFAFIELVTTDKLIRAERKHAMNCFDNASLALHASADVWMDTGDTCCVRVYVYGGARVVDIEGHATASISYFTGHILP